MGGVGKSYLVDRFYTQHDGTFPGGYIRLAVDPETPGSGGELLTQIADRLKLPPADAAGLVARLQAPLTLLHVENVDTDERPPPSVLWRCACAAARWWSARISTLAGSGWWREVTLGLLRRGTGLDQLRQELGDAAPADARLRPLIGALGGLPLALHLAAGYLRWGETPDGFLGLLRRKGLSVEPIGEGDPTFMERSRERLDAVFELSLDAFGRKAEQAGRALARRVLCAGIWLGGRFWRQPGSGAGQSSGRDVRRPAAGGRCALPARPGTARGRHRLPAAPAAGRTRPQPVGPGRGDRTDDRVVLRKAA